MLDEGNNSPVAKEFLSGAFRGIVTMGSFCNVIPVILEKMYGTFFKKSIT